MQLESICLGFSLLSIEVHFIPGSLFAPAENTGTDGLFVSVHHNFGIALVQN